MPRKNRQYLASYLKWLDKANMDETLDSYRSLQNDPDVDDWFIAQLGKDDLYFLLHRLLHRPDLGHPWLFARVREYEQAPYDHLDLWAREHYKSTIITFGGGIQDMLRDQELTTCIFSHTRPKAKKFLQQIKQELETNKDLQDLYPDILYKEPKKASPKWSEDEGITVKRRGNAKEATFEAWGLAEGLPTGRHFGKLLYDDIVNEDSVTNPEMMEKTTSQLSLSYSLGKEGGVMQFVGTRYHFNDSYRSLMIRGTAKPRIHCCVPGNTYVAGMEGVLMDAKTLEKKRRDMGPYVFGTQLMLNPKADETQGFQREWLRHYRNAQGGKGLNIYMLVDAANSKKASSDYTAIMIIGLGQDMNYLVLDMVRDRLNLTQRAQRVFDLHKKWAPIEVRYEEYGMQGDIQHIEDKMETENYRFKIIKVGGKLHKADRVNRLIPMFEQGKVWLPTSLHVTNVEGETRDLVHDFIEDEFAAWPVPVHDDMMDCLARIAEPDLPLKWPIKKKLPDFTASADKQHDPGMGY